MNEGRAGDWTVVPILPPTETEQASRDIPPPAAPEDEDDVRGWKFGSDNKRRRIAVGLGDIYDPGDIKVKKKEGETPPPSVPKAEEDPAGSGATSVPKWTPRGWLKPGEAPSKSETPPADPGPPTTAESATKPEETDPLTISLSSTAAKQEELPVKTEDSTETIEPPPTSGMFRKRKAPASGAGSRASRR